GGTLRIPALAWFPGGGPGQTAEDLRRELAGRAGITDLPLAVARSLVRESPDARSASGETLAKWLERVRPDLQGKIQVAATWAAPLPVSGDWDGTARAQVAAFRR